MEYFVIVVLVGGALAIWQFRRVQRSTEDHFQQRLAGILAQCASEQATGREIGEILDLCIAEQWPRSEVSTRIAHALSMIRAKNPTCYDKVVQVGQSIVTTDDEALVKRAAGRGESQVSPAQPKFSVSDKWRARDNVQAIARRCALLRDIANEECRKRPLESNLLSAVRTEFKCKLREIQSCCDALCPPLHPKDVHDLRVAAGKKLSELDRRELDRGALVLMRAEMSRCVGLADELAARIEAQDFEQTGSPPTRVKTTSIVTGVSKGSAGRTWPGLVKDRRSRTQVTQVGRDIDSLISFAAFAAKDAIASQKEVAEKEFELDFINDQALRSATDGFVVGYALGLVTRSIETNGRSVAETSLDQVLSSFQKCSSFLSWHGRDKNLRSKFKEADVWHLAWTSRAR